MKIKILHTQAGFEIVIDHACEEILRRGIEAVEAVANQQKRIADAYWNDIRKEKPR